MNRIFSIVLLTMLIEPSSGIAQNATNEAAFAAYPVYRGQDLGLLYSAPQTTCKLWAPSASEVKLKLYAEGTGGKPIAEYELQKLGDGVWQTLLSGDLLGKYYTFQTRTGGQWNQEVPDPYALAVGVNGRRGMIVDMSQNAPDGWSEDQKPELKQPTDIVLYELHVRDLSTHASSGIKHAGKFLGIAESGTKLPSGLTTGLSHIKELGVTHVHLLPVFDFSYQSVDESRLDEAQFNWGYDPQNYNAPEGSYSTNPFDGRVRIKEFRQMVKTLHDHGLRVVMDVVYNHTAFSDQSVFEQLVPGYYYRQDARGGFSNASGCGNETASDREMVRRFIVDSVAHWATQYHIDGFRFDLMAIHDIQTINEVSERLHAIDPSIFVYGEGWTAGDSPLPVTRRALKKYTYKLNRVAAFSDDLRDGLKGSVFGHQDRGFASGKPSMEETIKFGIVAATEHPQIDYAKVSYSNEPWAGQPGQCINYVSCHDNHTLWDRLANSNPNASEADRIQMARLAQTVVLTSQGVPFLHAGAEFLRTKGGEENSYNLSDAVNQIDWSRKEKYRELFEYHRDLIRLRKQHPSFRMPTKEMIQQNLKFLDRLPANMVGYELNGRASGDSWQRILVLFNGGFQDQSIEIPVGDWVTVLDHQQINERGLPDGINAGTTVVQKSSAKILVVR